MKNLLLVLLCLTVISMGEVNAQDSDEGMAFYGYMIFELQKEGDDRARYYLENVKTVYFITDVLRECDYENYNYNRERPSSDDLVKYVRNRYPNYYKRMGKTVGYRYESDISSQRWIADHHLYPDTFREAYNRLRRERIDQIDKIRRSDDDPTIIMIRKSDFNFLQDCN